MFIEVLLALNTQNPAPIERKNRYRVLISYKIAATISSHLNAKKAKNGVFHVSLLDFIFGYEFYSRSILLYVLGLLTFKYVSFFQMSLQSSNAGKDVYKCSRKFVAQTRNVVICQSHLF